MRLLTLAMFEMQMRKTDHCAGWRCRVSSAPDARIAGLFHIVEQSCYMEQEGVECSRM